MSQASCERALRAGFAAIEEQRSKREVDRLKSIDDVISIAALQLTNNGHAAAAIRYRSRQGAGR